MNLTAVILTFRDNVVIAVAMLAFATFFLSALLLRRRRHGWWLSALLAAMSFVLGSVGVYTAYGLKIASVELVTYRAPQRDN